MKNNTIYWLWLLHALGGKSYKATRVYKQFESIEDIYNADTQRLMSVDGIDEEDKSALCDKDTTNANNYLRFCISKGIEIIPFDSEMYPEELKEIDNYPCVLFAYGNYKSAFSKPKVTIVGTRECTPYGESCTKNLGYALTKAGFTIVAGVAKGIDTAAISGAMAAGGSVIAILPGGHTRAQLDASYKFKDIFANGIVLSEHLPNTSTHRFSYHERNRLLSGLSLGTIVTQAPKSSGALITATHALNQNRDVFALVANTDMEQSYGSNLLLREGAIPLLDHHDVINYYQATLGDKINTSVEIDLEEIYKPKTKSKKVTQLKDYKRIAEKHLSYEGTVVFDCIGLDETDINAIVEKTSLPVSEVLAILSDLEASGAVTSCPGNKYKITL